MSFLPSLFRNAPKLKVNLPAIVAPPGRPATQNDRGPFRYDPRADLVPPRGREASPYDAPAETIAAPIKHQLKVTTRFVERDGSREIVAVFKNNSRYYYAGGKFSFRVKEGRKVVVQSCHAAYRTGRGNNSFVENCYTYIGCLNPGEYEECTLPGFYDPAIRQKVEISLLPY